MGGVETYSIIAHAQRHRALVRLKSDYDSFGAAMFDCIAYRFLRNTE